jgi:hypothetical protein
MAFGDGTSFANAASRSERNVEMGKRLFAGFAIVGLLAFPAPVRADIAADKTAIQNDFKTLQADEAQLGTDFQALIAALKANDAAAETAAKTAIAADRTKIQADLTQLFKDFAQLRADAQAAAAAPAAAPAP